MWINSIQATPRGGALTTAHFVCCCCCFCCTLNKKVWNKGMRHLMRHLIIYLWLAFLERIDFCLLLEVLLLFSDHYLKWLCLHCLFLCRFWFSGCFYSLDSCSPDDLSQHNGVWIFGVAHNILLFGWLDSVLLLHFEQCRTTHWF